jgi:hypothetical protein
MSGQTMPYSRQDLELLAGMLPWRILLAIAFLSTALLMLSCQLVGRHEY